MTRSRPLLACCALLAACSPRRAIEEPPAYGASAGAEPSAQGAPAVQLTFAWPDGLAMRVHTQLSKQDTGGKQDGGIAIERQHVTRVEAAGGELRIVDGEVEVLSSEGAADDAVRVLRGSPVQAWATRVARDGSFLGVEDAEGAAARMIAAVSGLSEEQRANLAEAISPQMLTSMAQADWHERVGFWAGAELALGVEYEARSEGSLPPPIPVEVKYVMRYSASEYVPCAGGGEPRCIRLDSVTTIDPADMARATEALLQVLGGAGGELRIEALDVRIESSLVTDPATLVPQRFAKSKRVVLSIRTETGEQGGERIEKEQQTYTVLGGS